MPDIESTINKVKSFVRLPLGWHFGEGEPISDEMCSRGLALLAVAEIGDIKRANAFPGIDGELQITFHYFDYNIAFTLELDDTVTVVEDKNGHLISDEEGISDETAKAKVWEWAQKNQNISESYTSVTIGTKKIRDFPLRHFARRRRTRVSQSLIQNALNSGEINVADTSKHTIQMWQELLSSSGESRAGLSRKRVRLNRRRPIPAMSATTIFSD